MHLGASPARALAFLIAGSATNPAFFTTVWKMLGRRTTLLYVLSVALSAVVCGLLLDQVFSLVRSAAPQLDSHAHAMSHGGWLAELWAIALAAVLALVLFLGMAGKGA